MIILLIHLLRLLPFLFGGHRQLALENLALRQQLAVYKRTVNRPKLQRSDRLLWVWLSRVWPAWRQALVIVAPATVLCWQRRRFRRHWATLSGRRPAGHPPVDAAIKALVRRMACQRPPYSEPPGSGKLSHPGSPILSQAGSPILSHPGTAIESHPGQRDRIPSSFSPSLAILREHTTLQEVTSESALLAS